MKNGTFRPGWRLTILVLVMVPGMLMLGFWQLDRAEYKRELETIQYLREGALPLTESQLLSEPEPGFARVALVGQFVPDKYFLLDNQVREGVVGYRVIQVFATLAGHVFLVDRGWLPAGPDRQLLPVVPQASDGSRSEAVDSSAALRILARVWPDLGLTPIYATDDWGTHWPKRIQRAELNRMKQLVGADLGFILKLESGQPGVLKASATDFNFNPQRHTGYAYQWFTMSVVLLLAYFLFGYRRAR